MVALKIALVHPTQVTTVYITSSLTLNTQNLSLNIRHTIHQHWCIDLFVVGLTRERERERSVMFIPVMFSVHALSTSYFKLSLQSNACSRSCFKYLCCFLLSSKPQSTTWVTSVFSIT